MIRTKRSTARGLPSPLVEAVTKHVGRWDIHDSGVEQLGKTDNVHHTMLVPLNDDDCTCGLSHGSFVRGHELLHAKFSPETPRPIVVKVPGQPDLKVSEVNVVAAEEYRINRILGYTEGQSVLRSGWCRQLVDSGIKGLMDRKEYQEVIRVSLIGGPGYWDLIWESLDEYKATLLTTQGRTANPKVMELLEKRIRLTTALMNVLDTYSNEAALIMERSADWGVKQVPGWGAVEELAAYLQLNLDSLDEKANKVMNGGNGGESDLDILDKRLDGEADLRPDAEVEKNGEKLTMKDGGYGNGPVVWGKPYMTEADMPLKFPAWKRQKTNRAVDEGTIPRYMHRWMTDKKVFHRTKRTSGGTILIDDSGSMGFTSKDLEEIITAAPAATVALYAGSDTVGEIRVVAKDGQRAETDALSIREHGGNDIDGPALEWLGEQSYPRIWITDGGVVSLSHGFSEKTVEAAKKLCVEHRVTVVETADEAAKALKSGLMAR